MNGLFSKNKYGVFESYIQNFDIVCLSETKSDSIPPSEYPGFKSFSLPKSNSNLPFGGVHGIAMLIRDCLFDQCTLINKTSSDCVLWVKLKNQIILGFELLIGAVYIPCDNSEYHSNTLFEDLFDDILSLNVRFNLPVLLVGDFNARTHSLNDFATPDSSLLNCNEFFIDPIEVTANLDLLDITTVRSNKDTHVNSNGLKLIDLCQATNLNILNGRVGTDAGVGEFTCKRVNGCSTIDYALASACLFPSISELYIDTFDKCLSDVHSPVCVSISREQVFPVVLDPVVSNKPVKNEKSKVVRTRWEPQLQTHYTDAFCINEVENFSEALDAVSSQQVTQESIDNLAKKLTDFLITPAKSIGVTTEIHVNNNGKVKNNRRHCNQSWFNAECEAKRKEYLQLKNKLRQTQVQQERHDLEVEYKRKFSKYKKFHSIHPPSPWATS